MKKSILLPLAFFCLLLWAGFSYLILMQHPKDSMPHQFINVIEESSVRASALIQGMRALYREAGVIKEPVNINDVVGDYMKSSDYETLIQRHPTVGIEVALGNQMGTIQGTPAHLRKVLMYLVSDISEACKGMGHIMISTKNRNLARLLKGDVMANNGKYAVLAIGSNKMNISDVEIDHCLNPFYREKVMRGLLVAAMLVRDYKGYINVQRDPHGSTLELHFPVMQEQ